MYPIHISFSLCVACGSGQPCHFCQYVIQLIFSGSCSAGWFQGGSSCYYFSAASTVKSWDDARTFCRSQADGADLVVFGSAAEQAAVTSIRLAQGKLYFASVLHCLALCVDRCVMPFLHHPHRSSPAACGKIYILVFSKHISHKTSK